MKLIKENIVSGSLSDANANLSIIGVFQIVEDMVTELMGKLEIDGITTKEKYNAIWVMTKNRVKFLKSLKWGEKFISESFISIVSPAKIIIDTALKDKEGGICIYSRVELCALDIESGKVRKTCSVGVNESFVDGTPLLEIKYSRFDNIEMPLFEKFKVRSTNIDFYQHTNNIEYIRFILNSYSVKQLKTLNIKEMEVNYLSQSFENEELSLYRENFNNRDLFVIKNDDKIVIKCEIILKL